MLVSDAIANIGADMLKVLSDGEWHTLGELLPCGDTLSPEASSQKYFGSLAAYQREAGKKLPLEAQVEKGRKSVVLRRLNQWVTAGNVEREGTGFQRRYRKVPDKEVQKEKAQAKEMAKAKIIPGDHHVIRNFNTARYRAKNTGLRIAYGDDGITIGNGQCSKTYLSIEHVVAFLDGVEFNDNTEVDKQEEDGTQDRTRDQIDSD